MIKIRCSLVLFIAICGTLQSRAQFFGCTDPLANNYNPEATINNGSCTYNSVTIAPDASFTLAGTISETSGLVSWNSNLSGVSSPKLCFE